MWTPLRFTRSQNSKWIWYVTATDGTQEALFPIPTLRSLIAAGLANRGPSEPYITDATLERMELERLTPAQIAERKRALEIQAEITARDQALADAQAQAIQSPQWEDLGIVGPLFKWAKDAGPLGIPKGVYVAGGVVIGGLLLQKLLSRR